MRIFKVHQQTEIGEDAKKQEREITFVIFFPFTNSMRRIEIDTCGKDQDCEILEFKTGVENITEKKKNDLPEFSRNQVKYSHSNREEHKKRRTGKVSEVGKVHR